MVFDFHIAIDIGDGLTVASRIMKSCLLPLFLTTFIASALVAGDIDPRFDGRWVGTELYQYGTEHFGPGSSRHQMQVPAILGIADHGKTLGITKGFAKGRYEVVWSRSGGNTLEFQMPGTNGDKLLFLGRQHCTLKLSSDGNTIQENGVAIVSIDGHGHGLKNQVWATFHRSGAY